MKVTCDDCGSVQTEGNTACELCGASLAEEKQRKEQGSLPALLLAAIFATGLLCVAPAFLLKFFYFADTSWEFFGGGYALVWLLGIAIGQYYQPRDNYDFGWDAGIHGFIDNPFTLRDDRDRGHASVGMVLLPMNIVGGLWRAVFSRLVG